MRNAGRDFIQCATCALVCAEQLPDTTAAYPPAAGSAAAFSEPVSLRVPKFAGNPMAMPEPPVSSGSSAQAVPSASRSSSATASTIA
ncbi:hypothetical protein D3C83_49250 [compost metagenome]